MSEEAFSEAPKLRCCGQKIEPYLEAYGPLCVNWAYHCHNCKRNFWRRKDGEPGRISDPTKLEPS